MEETSADDDTFTQFVAGTRSALLRSAYVICGDWHEAEDLTQLALMAVLRRWDRLYRPATATGYTRVVMHRIYLSDRRRARWHLETAHADVPDQPARAESENVVIDRVTLSTALRALPPRQRAAVILRYIDDLDVARTAEILECEPSTIRSQTTRALAALRRALESYR